MLNLYGPVNTLGMGTHCVNFARALESLGEEIALFSPLGSIGFNNEQIQRWLSNRATFDKTNPSLMIFDMEWFTQFIGNPRIGFAVFETDQFTPVQLAAMRSCDAIVTPSEWGRRVLSLAGIDSTVIHEGYDPEQFKLVDVSERKGTIKFCHVGKSEVRKGTMQILKCFFNALENEDAILEMHCENPFMQSWPQEICDWLTSCGFSPQGTGISGPFTYLTAWRRAGLTILLKPAQSENLAHVYAGSDCGIFPSKGEAWGLPILECLATGVPAIVGNWSGQSEYLGDSYPNKLTLEKFHSEPANDGFWFHGNRGNWNVPQDAELTEKIRWAHQNIRQFRASEEWAREVTRLRGYTWEAAALEFRKCFTNKF